MPVEIVRLQPDAVDGFYREAEREALRTLYGFSVIWHEQRQSVAARDGEMLCGAATIRIAASLAEIEQLLVAADRRRNGIGQLLLAAIEDVANYYNCHKMTVMVPHRSTAQSFFEACDYREEAVLPQHAFKLDVAVLRKFLL